MENLELEGSKIFDSIKHIDEDGNEFWYARELQRVLEYTDWRNFEKVINKADFSAKNSNKNDNYWVVEVNTPIITGKGKKVRDTIKELNGTMPEDIETPSKSLKDIKKDSINYL